MTKEFWPKVLLLEQEWDEAIKVAENMMYGIRLSKKVPMASCPTDRNGCPSQFETRRTLNVQRPKAKIIRLLLHGLNVRNKL